VQLTSGERGGSSDLETRIDQVPPEHPAAQSASALQELLHQTPVLASLQIQFTERDKAGVFVRLHSAVVLMGSSDWDEVRVRSALTEFIRPDLTASQLGVGWQQRTGYQELDGLWPLAVAVRGDYLLVSDQPEMLNSLLANFTRTPDRKPADLLAGFRHARERNSFNRLAEVVDRPSTGTSGSTGASHQPQFFSENVASLSAALAAVSMETIEVRGDGGTVRQTVTYEWSH
jgi:hypothetical protein